MAELEYKVSSYAEIKDFTSKDDMTFEGYLAVFGNVDEVGDVIEKGAFQKCIEKYKQRKPEDTIFVLWNHGGWGASSCDYVPVGFFEMLGEDDFGLRVKAKIFSNDMGKNTHIILKEAPLGSISMSIGYKVRGMRWASENHGEKDEQGAIRYLTDIDLFEGSLTIFPANKKARITDVKSIALKKREIENCLKENGYSAKQAVTITALLSRYIDGQDERKSQVSQTEKKQVEEAFNVLQNTVNKLNSILGKENEQYVPENVDKDNTETKTLIDALNQATANIEKSNILFTINKAKNAIKM